MGQRRSELSPPLDVTSVLNHKTDVAFSTRRDVTLQHVSGGDISTRSDSPELKVTAARQSLVQVLVPKVAFWPALCFGTNPPHAPPTYLLRLEDGVISEHLESCCKTRTISVPGRNSSSAVVIPIFSSVISASHLLLAVLFCSVFAEGKKRSFIGVAATPTDDNRGQS